MKALYVFIFMLVAGTVAAQQPGTLDKTFARKGRQWDTVARYADFHAMIVQPDGKIVIGGPGNYKGNTTYKIDRSLADGTPDRSFGSGGSVIIPLPFSDNKKSKAYVTYLALLPDGKILAGGNSTYIVKISGNGIVDSSFGSNGITRLYDSHYGNSMVVQKDGKIVVGGYTFINYVPQQVMLQRLLSDGRPDKTFGNKGEIVERTGQIAALALQPNGKIVAAGYSGNPYGQDTLQFLIERYNSNGILDKTFSGDGVLDTSLKANTCYIADLALQPDGKIVVAGATYVYPGYPHFTTVRYNANGSLDKTYGEKGVVITLFKNAFGDVSADAGKVILWNNRIIAAGYNSASNRSGTNGFDVSLVAYKSNGIIDSSFAVNGIQTANYGYNDYLGSAALQPDGKIILLDIGRDYDQTYETRNLLRYYGYPASSFVSALDKTNALSVSLASSLCVYPNPAKDYVVVTGLYTNDKTTIAITDISGKTMASDNTSGASQYKCDVSKLTAGVYYLQINSAGKTEVLKFIKE